VTVGRIGGTVILMALNAWVRVGAQAPRYRVADSIIVGQVGGDFFTLDAVHRRLYGGGPHVVDIDAKQLVADVADSTAGGGFDIAPELGRGVVRNGTVFTLASGAVVAKLRAGGDASFYDAASGRAFLLGDTVSVVDLKTATLVGKVPVPGAGESGVSDGRGRVYLNLIGKDSIAVLDAKTLKVVAEYSVAPAKSPMGLAIDAKHHRLFAACDGQVAVLDADNGKVVATVAAPGHSDENAFDPGTGLLFEPGGAGKGITIIHEDAPDRYSVVQTLVDPAATSVKLVVDTKTHRVYMPHRTADKQFAYVVLAPER
jgi:DNA-binding beta-propeller fold protein YncE